MILITTWLLFTLFISFGETLIKHREVGRFLMQVVLYHTLLFLTLASLISTSLRSPGTPDQTLAPSLPATISTVNSSQSLARKPFPLSLNREQQGAVEDGTEHLDEDNVPLRFLRNTQWVKTRTTKERPSPLPLSSTRNQSKFRSGPRSTPFQSPETSLSEYSSFPLSATPHDLKSARVARNDVVKDILPEYQEESEKNEGLENDPLISSTASGSGGKSLMAKKSTGGARWCKKCEGWKPDRCHHCKYCETCVLKMDHHCPWVGTCVGYRNYKSFLLFVTYGTLLAVFITSQAGYEIYRSFQAPDDAISQQPPLANSTATLSPENRIETGSWSDELGLGPAVCIMLTIMGSFITLSVGGLACFHWWLASHNMTTLENITHSYPTALLDIPLSPSEEGVILSPFGQKTEWKPDHKLTRRERLHLRYEAQEINVYDLGVCRNLRELFFGEDIVNILNVGKALWPGCRPRSQIYDKQAGHFHSYDPSSLAKLKELTLELRYGVIKDGAEIRNNVEDDSQSEDESSDESSDGNDEFSLADDELDPESKSPQYGKGAKRVGGVDWFEVKSGSDS
nr:hypothetical protein L203_00603 [Cryptococcus depauperatus CBS 7841]